jgi:PAS domain S-box-containing protein
MTSRASKARLVLKAAILGALYFATAWLGLRFSPVSGFATLVWPPTGIALAALALYGPRLWPGIFLAATAVNFLTGAPLHVAVAIGVGNTLGSLAAWRVLVWAGFRPTTDRLKDIFALTSFAAPVAATISATVGTLSLTVGGIAGLEAFVSTWRAWWIGDLLGILIFAPFLLTWFRPWTREDFRFWRLLEATSLLATFAAAAWLLFGGVLADPAAAASFLYVIAPPIIWAALRFPPRETASGVFIISFVAIWGTVTGHGPFVRMSVSESLFYLQVFMAVIAVSAMVIAINAEERRRAEDDLKKSNREITREARRLSEEKSRTEALLESLGEGVISVDRRGRVVTMNPAAERMFEVDIASARGRHVSEAIVLRDEKGRPVPEDERPINVSLKTGKTVSTSLAAALYFTRKDGSRLPIAVTSGVVKAGGETLGGVDIFRDISKEKEIDRAKTEFVSLASHQLRTPLTTARWYLELMQAEEKALSPEQKTNLEELRRSMQRMSELVNDLLSVSRIERGVFSAAQTRVDPVELAKKAIEDYRLQMREKGIVLQERYDDPPKAVIADPQLLHIALEDLVSNAIKYNSPRGTLSVILGRKRAGETIGGRKAGKDSLLITVADTGWGIPKHQQEKIFTKFFRAQNVLDREVEGTGLGLYITKAIVEKAGGEIWFESEEGKGTSFFVLLPAA